MNSVEIPNHKFPSNSKRVNASYQLKPLTIHPGQKVEHKTLILQDNRIKLSRGLKLKVN